MNTMTIKLDNYNNLVITIVFAYLKAAMYADDPIPSFCRQDYGTSLLTCGILYFIMYMQLLKILPMVISKFSNDQTKTHCGCLGSNLGNFM
jgi:hypothetical protein